MNTRYILYIVWVWYKYYNKPQPQHVPNMNLSSPSLGHMVFSSVFCNHDEREKQWSKCKKYKLIKLKTGTPSWIIHSSYISISNYLFSYIDLHCTLLKNISFLNHHYLSATPSFSCVDCWNSLSTSPLDLRMFSLKTNLTNKIYLHCFQISLYKNEIW